MSDSRERAGCRHREGETGAGETGEMAGFVPRASALEVGSKHRDSWARGVKRPLSVGERARTTLPEEVPVGMEVCGMG